MYDLIIIWTWSAGLPAWMYASRYKIKNLVIWALPWWALATSHKVENIPGILSASWKEIMDNFKEHAIKSGSQVLQEMVDSVEKTRELFKINTSSWKKFESKFLILATWNKYRRLWVKGEEEFLWKWVSYCATCDGMFFKDREVVIVWWWNTAVTESLYLAEICKKIYLVHRKNTFRAEDIWLEKIKKNPKINLVLNEEVEEIDLVILCKEVSKNLYIRKIVIDNNLQKNIHFLWELEDKKKSIYYKNSLWIIFPSLYETFPFHLQEWIFFSKAIIASNSKNIKDIFGKNILYFSPISVNDMKEKIEIFLKKKNKLNYSDVFIKYNPENTVKKLVEIIKNF